MPNEPVPTEPVPTESGTPTHVVPPTDVAPQAGASKTPTDPPPTPTNPQTGRRDFAVPTSPSGLVIHRGTLVWTDLSGAIWAMAADGSTRPKKLSDQHREGLAFHPFVAGDRVLAKADKELLVIEVPDGPVTRVHLTGVPGLPEELVGDATSVYLTIFNQKQVMRVPIGGGAAEHVLDVARGVLALHGDTLYVASYDTGALLAVPTAGGKPRTVAHGLRHPTAIAIDDTAAYVYSEDDQRVLRVELATGASSILGEHLNNSDELAIAGDSLYTVSWPGKLVRLPKVPGRAPDTLADDLHVPRAVVSDDHFVYVTTQEPPRIVRIPRN